MAGESACTWKSRPLKHPAKGTVLLQVPIKVQSFLGNVSLFKELASDELDRIAAKIVEVRAARAEVLFRRGDPALGFHIIVFGQVKLAFSSPRGDEKVVDLIGPGQSFGEAVMFMERPHVVTAQALSDSLLLYIAREIVFEELERDPRFVRRMIAGLSSRLHGLMSDLESDSLRSGTQRIIGYLLRDSDDNPESKNALEVTLSANKGVIASRLSLTQEHFSRILHDLSARRLIEVHGRSIYIPDVAKLRACSD
ncbi:MAG: Crp/Fnr family transcriptional regulator [Betaproteobacteria bacterium RIFCSPLOWO2_12_FULL_64_23]|nr:MAG: Crp/Fnr family transcriptional regulator [Betaproteobacteria bacterium RIFCSPLOWO2_12_FULL_64_23]